MACPFPCHLRCAVSHAEHGGGVGSVDIRIEEAHPQAAGGQGAGQVDGHGAFAHPTFAATHGNHVLDPGNGLAFGHLAMATRAMTTGTMACSPDRGCAGWLAHFDLDVVDAIETKQRLFDLLGDLGLLALGESRQGEAHQGPLALEPGILKPAQLQQAAPTACVLDDLEGDTGLLNGRHGHWHLDP